MSEKLYERLPVQMKATQWFKNGDHPHDETVIINGEEMGPFKSEGKVVRRYRLPDVNGQSECMKCGHIMHVHGWIDTLEGGHIVCVGDWIVTGVKGERWPVKPAIFAETYRLVPSSHRGG